MPVKAKPWWESTTILINITGIVILILTFIVNTHVTNDQDIVALILAIINILNRVRSTISPVTLVKQ